MNNWKMYVSACAICLLMWYASACNMAPVKNKSAWCRLRFDTQDPGVMLLSEENQRMILTLEVLCGRTKLLKQKTQL